ncbi:MAG: hypothetical protein J6Z11_03310 [Candidatus Riflebacteria bacterium]|nr:hypothetical protein [Candidatus Riflebacteria bacterium]
MESIFGDIFNIQENKKNVKNLVDKVNNEQATADIDIDKKLKSKKLSIEDRLYLINENVLTILGKQRANVIVIRDKETFKDYITNSINSGRIAIDTETNNSTDPSTCQIMGLCLYYPGGKQAYIPVNHVDYKTGIRLENQLTEDDCREQLQRVVSYKKQCEKHKLEAEKKFNNGEYPKDYVDQTFENWFWFHAEEYNIPHLFVIMHNGKFDYEVIKCTCKIEVEPDWDTMIAYKLIDENEKMSLKEIYIKRIDPSQTKYSIEKFFKNISYAFIDPNIFALYAATDSMMTDKVFLWELPFYQVEANKKVFWLLTHVEIPIVVVTAEMELRGVKIDTELATRLKEKYQTQLDIVDSKIEALLADLQDLIEKWKLTPEANEKTKQYQPKKTKKSLAEIEEAYPLFDEKENKRYKLGKPKILQITDPINLSSPVQLAILFFDILGAPEISKKAPRGTGSETLKAFKDRFSKYEEEKKINDDFEEDQVDDEENDEEKADDIQTLDDIEEETTEKKESALTIKKNKAILNLSKLILQRRGYVKLITTYIDVIPKLATHWPDGRVRSRFNSVGTDTGRYSSGGKINFFENGEPVVVNTINLQNIPSHSKDIRLLFIGDTTYENVEANSNRFCIFEYEEVETSDGWKYPKDLVIGDILITDEGPKAIKNILTNKPENETLMYGLEV